MEIEIVITDYGEFDYLVTPLPDSYGMAQVASSRAQGIGILIKHLLMYVSPVTITKITDNTTR